MPSVGASNCWALLGEADLGGIVVETLGFSTLRGFKR